MALVPESELHMQLRNMFTLQSAQNILSAIETDEIIEARIVGFDEDGSAILRLTTDTIGILHPEDFSNNPNVLKDGEIPQTYLHKYVQVIVDHALPKRGSLNCFQCDRRSAQDSVMFEVSDAPDVVREGVVHLVFKNNVFIELGAGFFARECKRVYGLTSKWQIFAPGDRVTCKFLQLNEEYTDLQVECIFDDWKDSVADLKVGSKVTGRVLSKMYPYISVRLQNGVLAQLRCVDRIAQGTELNLVVSEIDLTRHVVKVVKPEEFRESHEDSLSLSGQAYYKSRGSHRMITLLCIEEDSEADTSIAPAMLLYLVALNNMGFATPENCLRFIKSELGFCYRLDEIADSLAQLNKLGLVAEIKYDTCDAYDEYRVYTLTVSGQKFLIALIKGVAIMNRRRGAAEGSERVNRSQRPADVSAGSGEEASVGSTVRSTAGGKPPVFGFKLLRSGVAGKALDSSADSFEDLIPEESVNTEATMASTIGVSPESEESGGGSGESQVAQVSEDSVVKVDWASLVKFKHDSESKVYFDLLQKWAENLKAQTSRMPSERKYDAAYMALKTLAKNYPRRVNYVPIISEVPASLLYGVLFANTVALSSLWEKAFEGLSVTRVVSVSFDKPLKVVSNSYVAVEGLRFYPRLIRSDVIFNEKCYDYLEDSITVHGPGVGLFVCDTPALKEKVECKLSRQHTLAVVLTEEEAQMFDSQYISTLIERAKRVYKEVSSVGDTQSGWARRLRKFKDLHTSVDSNK